MEMKDRLIKVILEKHEKSLDEFEGKLYYINDWIYKITETLDIDFERRKKRMWSFLPKSSWKKIELIKSLNSNIKGLKLLEKLLESMGLLLDVSIGLCKESLIEKDAIIQAISDRDMWVKKKNGEIGFERKKNFNEMTFSRKKKKEPLFTNLKHLVNLKFDQYDDLIEKINNEMRDEKNRYTTHISKKNEKVEELKRLLSQKNEDNECLKVNMKRLGNIAIQLKKQVAQQ